MSSTNPSNPFEEQNKKFSAISLDESERGLILISTSNLDFKLEKILKLFLVPSRTADDRLFHHLGALGSFSNKIEMVHRLGIIDNAFSDAIDALRKSRNRMAHELDESLEQSPHVDHLDISMKQIQKSELLSKMVSVYYDYWAKQKEQIESVPHNRAKMKEFFKDGRMKLNIIHMVLSSLLDYVYLLVDSGVDKNKIKLGLSSFDDDSKRLDALMKEARP